MLLNIPLARPSFDEREAEAVGRVLASGWVVQGPEVEALERSIAEMQNARHCVVVSSGTAALHVSYLALGIAPGHAVFVPSFAWPSAANMAIMVGARPVFVDVLPDTYNIDPRDLQRRIRQCQAQGWGEPRCVVPVHEFGLPADMDAVLAIARHHGLLVIEDAACALGATREGRPVGTLGELGVFSFHPRKAITTGEGGAIVTNDETLAAKCRMWRNHGQMVLDGNRDFKVAGLNYRMTEIQAAIGRVQLTKFPGILSKRKEVARHYLSALSGGAGLTLPLDDAEQTWQTFMIVLEQGIRRAHVVERLSKQGIGVGPGSIAAHGRHVYRQRFGYRVADFPVSTKLHEQGLALPLYEALTNHEVIRVVDRLNEAIHLELGRIRELG